MWMNPQSPPQRPVRELPPELWLHVVKYLEDEDIHKALGLNRIFFEKAMARYREVNLKGLDQSHFMRTIDALGRMLSPQLRSPVVGNRVESLKLQPSASWHAIYVLPTPTLQKVNTKWSIRSLLRLPQKHGDRQEQMSKGVAHHSDPQFLFTKKLAAVVVASPNLVNVKELTVDWDPDTSMPPFCPLLRIWLPVFGSTLRSLSLTAHQTIVEAFLPPSISLPCLEELSVSLLRNEPLLPDFINGLSPTLRSLSLDTNMSSLLPFALLEVFPHLTKLSLTMPFDTIHFIDPTGVNGFLIRHNGLQELTLLGRPQAYCGPLEPFRMLSRSLRSFTLIDVYLAYSEVCRLVTVLAGPLLKVLSLTIDALSTDLIDFLAKACPELDTLTLRVQYFDLSRDQAAPTIHEGLIIVVERFSDADARSSKEVAFVETERS
ncbi:hypothetical protein DXG01_007193 [Tephrocybe rancida]|nr:hypothetical protein DXG01_007193 [Tephrocybe rancida]